MVTTMLKNDPDFTRSKIKEDENNHNGHTYSRLYILC